MTCMAIRNEAWLVIALAYTFVSNKYTKQENGNEPLQAIHTSS